MWNAFKYTIKDLIQEKSTLFWALLFPIIMASLFFVMFSNLDTTHTFNPIRLAVIEDAAYEKAEAFDQLIEGLSASGEDQILETRFVSTESEAKNLLENGEIIGYLFIDENSTPALVFSNVQELSNIDSINQTILKDILDSYLRVQANVATIAKENPTALADPAFVESLSDQKNYTREISVTANAANESVRYFYALLGFSSIMAANIALSGITRTQANLSALGARRALGATSRAKTLTATLAASWLLSFCCLMVGFIYMRFVLGIDFGGRDSECTLGIAIASLMATALGTCIGSIPKLPLGAKSGLLTGLSCTLALFAGLYGTSSQQLTDELTRTAPLVQAANPVKQVADLFYSLYYYDTLDHFFAVIGTILVITAVLSAIAAIFMRRQRYASL